MAEQVVLALTGGVVSTAVNIPAVSAEDMEVLGPYIPLAQRLGRIAAGAGRRASSASRSSTWAGSPSATPACSRSSVLTGIFAGRTEEDVNLVNAPDAGRGARDRGLRAPRDRRPRLRRPRARHGHRLRRADPRRRHDARAAAPPAPAGGLGPALQPADRRSAPDAVPLLRRPRHGRPRRHRASASTAINISAAAVGRQAAGDTGERPRGDGGHDRRPRPGRGRRRRSRPPTASSAGRSISL